MAEYKFDFPIKGKCLILNYENFEDEPKRNGTDKDATLLHKVFSKLNFDVQNYKDLTREDTFKVLDAVARADFSQCACFVCCILTHGDDNGMLHATDERYKLASVLTRFNSKIYPNLEGKPKIFFIQACRGCKYDDGIMIETADCGLSNDFPRYVDLLVVQSTPPGYYSWRNPQNGSWFIQNLCKCFAYSSDEHLNILKVLRLVNYDVAYQCQSNTPSRSGTDNKKQIPCVTSTLRKKIVFSETSFEKSQCECKNTGDDNIGEGYDVGKDCDDLDKNHDDVDKVAYESYPQHQNRSVRKLMMAVESDVYHVENPQNIKCFIIYNYDFNKELNMKHLSGSATNAVKLYHNLTEFGFTADLMPNCTKKCIDSSLSREIENCNSDIECFLSFIITRTDEDNFIYAKDCRYTRESVTSMFDGDKCPALASIPKIFFFLVSKSEHIMHETADSGNLKRIPVEADFLIVDSVLKEEHFSQTTRSFIENLCSSLRKSQNQTDFFELLVLINGDLTSDQDYHRKNEKTFVLTSTLTRSLVLKTNPLSP